MKKIILFIMIINVLISFAQALPNNNEKLMNSSEMEILNLGNNNFDEILNSVNLVDSVFVYNSNRKTLKYSYNYNNNNQILIITTFQLLNDIWTNYCRITYTFDDSKQVIAKLMENWLGEDWQNDSMTKSTYNLQGKIEKDSAYAWKNQNWELTSKTSYSYYNNQNLMSRIFEDFYKNDWYTIIWEEFYYNEKGHLEEYKRNGVSDHDRYIYSYDERGNMIKEVHQIDGMHGYYNDTKESFFYDEKGKLDSTIYETWAFELLPDFGDWKKESKEKYIYDSNNNLVQLFFEPWDSVLQWQNGSSIRFFCNERNQILVELHEFWNTEFEWQLSERLTYSYDEFIYPIKITSEKYTDNNWIHYDQTLAFNDSLGNNFSYSGYKLEIFWNTSTGIDDELSDDNFMIYPNPTSDYIEINYPGFVEEIRIYNALGECVLSFPIHPMTSSQRMNIEHLPSGIYFVKIGCAVKRFIKI